jgi:hypothetical protein
MKEKKPFWDKEENIGFVSVEAWDGLVYKVWNEGTPETIQKIADILAKVRYDINRLLIYLCKNKEKWENHPIAFGMYHTFDIHAPHSNQESFYSDNAMNLINRNSGKDLFNYQEMTPNDDGILGLNKPKELTEININFKNKKINYEIATKRSIFLTIRPKLSSHGDPNYIEPYNKILDLAIHELTHTTCNDTRWKSDNHKHPYPVYHKMMRQFAKYCNVIK